ncbi:MAG: CHAT domain-containing protein [Planctomycetes bacterium]|nr:CHAT domain-containing protein [Planctomycetota bacterium]
MYDKLIQPADGQLGAITHLVVVGDGILREIPFEVFVDQTQKSDGSHRFLLERYTISYAPSATVAAMIAERGRRRDWAFDFWGFASTRFQPEGDETEGVTPAPPTRGDATSASSLGAILRSARSLDLSPLPYAAKEVERIASRFAEGRRRVYVDYRNGDETAKQVLTSASASGELRSVRFLHFATHAILDADRPTRSGLVMCPPYPDAPTRSTDGTARERNGAKANETSRVVVRSRRSSTPPTRGDATFQGRQPAILSLSEIAALELGSEVVVLSACHTLSGRPVDGDWLNGLARSIFVAGGDNVVCTLWQVSDRSALMLMPAFYRNVFSLSSGGSGPAGALREAKLALLPSPMFRHPSNWAAFVCHGGLAPAD